MVFFVYYDADEEIEFFKKQKRFYENRQRKINVNHRKCRYAYSMSFRSVKQTENDIVHVIENPKRDVLM